MSGSESHLRIDDNVIFSTRIIVVECTVYHAAVVDDDRLEKILFPFLVPVFVFRFGNGISDFRIGYREVFQCFFQGIFVEQALLYISLNASFTLDKTFETYFTCQCRQDIGNNFIARLCSKSDFKVFHIYMEIFVCTHKGSENRENPISK